MNITAPSPVLRTSPPSIRAIGWGRARTVVSPLALLVLWQLGSASGVIPASKLAAPSAIVHAFWTLAISGALWNDLVVSLGRDALGATIGVLLGIVLALAVGLWKANDVIVDPVLQMLRTLPYLGMTPLLILWFGIGEAPKIALVAFASMFPVYLTLLGGIRAVSQVARMCEDLRPHPLGNDSLRHLTGIARAGARRPALRTRCGPAEPRRRRADRRRPGNRLPHHGCARLLAHRP